MRIDLLIGLVVIIVLSMLFGASFSDGSDGTRETYCDMRQIYKDSQGQWGWPAFDDTKEEQCDES